VRRITTSILPASITGQFIKSRRRDQRAANPILRGFAVIGLRSAVVAIDPSLSGMQKMKQLHAIHSENAPELQKILSPAQYQELQAIREQDIKKAIAAKRAAR
jgi:hypothetical protein